MIGKEGWGKRVASGPDSEEKNDNQENKEGAHDVRAIPVEDDPPILGCGDNVGDCNVKRIR